MNKQKHLTLDSRIAIETKLNERESFKSIGRFLGKDCTTICTPSILSSSNLLKILLSESDFLYTLGTFFFLFLQYYICKYVCDSILLKVSVALQIEGLSRSQTKQSASNTFMFNALHPYALTLFVKFFLFCSFHCQFIIF